MSDPIADSYRKIAVSAAQLLKQLGGSLIDCGHPDPGLTMVNTGEEYESLIAKTDELAERAA